MVQGHQQHLFQLEPAPGDQVFGSRGFQTQAEIDVPGLHQVHHPFLGAVQDAQLHLGKLADVSGQEVL